MFQIYTHPRAMSVYIGCPEAYYILSKFSVLGEPFLYACLKMQPIALLFTVDLDLCMFMLKFVLVFPLRFPPSLTSPFTLNVIKDFRPS